MMTKEPSLPAVQEEELISLLEREEEFNLEELIAQHQRLLKQTVPSELYKRKEEQFLDICTQVQNALGQIIDVDGDQDSQSDWVKRQHNAITGNKQAITYFIEVIQDVLRKENITFDEYPRFYDSLAEAIFHEVWGISVLAKWDKLSNSEAALIHGTNLWIDEGGGFKLQPEKFRSQGVVERVKKGFIHLKPDSILNREHPNLEIEREDGSRISMTINPLAKTDYVIFRRFVIETFSLEKQASLKTIPLEDIPIYRGIARAMANTVIAGPVKSAKSTFLKTMLAERSADKVHVFLEKHFELAFSKHFPERLSYEFQAKEGELHDVIPIALRMEHDSMVVGEIRSLEIEAFLQSTERGVRGAMSTYHLTDDTRVVKQLTNHSLDLFPSRRYEIELERVATAVDFVITTEPDEDKKTKRITGLSEVIWEDELNEHRVVPLIKYNTLRNEYSYSDNISNKLLFKMAKKDLDATKLFLQTLRERSKEFPMQEENEQYEELFKLLGMEQTA